MQLQRFTACALLAIVSFSCGSPLPKLSESPSRIVVGDSADRERISSTHWTLVQTIRVALREGADEKALVLTQRLETEGGEGAEDLVAGFRRVLKGREIVRTLDLQLSVERASGPAAKADERVLFLHAGHSLTSDLALWLAVGRLDHLVWTLAPTGLETRELESLVTHELEEITLAPGDTRRIELLRYHLPMRGAIAVRERWTLEFGNGHLEWDGHTLPAASVAAGSLHREELPPEISTEPVEPAKLVEYVQSKRIFMPLLLEHAVRIDSDRREEAVRGLLPVLERLAVENPKRGRMLAPALRWLTRSTQPGVEPIAWVDALREHLRPATPSNLVLPNR